VHYQLDPVRTTKTSVLGAINMLGLAKRLKAKILQASTSEVYGDPLSHPQSESYWGNVNPIGPRACYDEGKRCAETLFFDYYRQHNLRIRVVRIFNTYGPRIWAKLMAAMRLFSVAALRRAARRKSRRPAQASGLTSEILSRIISGLPETAGGLRDAALISVGYDTLCRSCELAAMRVEHLQMSAGGDWSVLIARSKGDQAGDGRIAWLSPTTVDRLRRWMEVAEIAQGPLFRALHLRRVSETALNTSSIRRLIKRAAQSAGVEGSAVNGLSGHSMRVGAAQDMLVANVDALAIMQAGGWKTTAVLLRYVENTSTRALHEQRWQSVRALATGSCWVSGPGARPLT
jgi:integrase